MPLFRVEKEYVYDKSAEETLKDLQEALEKIGKVKGIDVEKGTISGKTRYRLLGGGGVKIEAALEAMDSKTKIIFHGKSADYSGRETQKGIERLFETMQNLENPEFTPSKTGISFGQVIANILTFIIAFVIGFYIENEWISIIILAVSIFLINYFFSISKKTRK